MSYVCKNDKKSYVLSITINGSFLSPPASASSRRKGQIAPCQRLSYHFPVICKKYSKMAMSNIHKAQLLRTLFLLFPCTVHDPWYLPTLRFQICNALPWRWEFVFFSHHWLVLQSFPLQFIQLPPSQKSRWKP